MMKRAIETDDTQEQPKKKVRQCEGKQLQLLLEEHFDDIAETKAQMYIAMTRAKIMELSEYDKLPGDTFKILFPDFKQYNTFTRRRIVMKLWEQMIICHATSQCILCIEIPLL